MGRTNALERYQSIPQPYKITMPSNGKCVHVLHPNTVSSGWAVWQRMPVQLSETLPCSHSVWPVLPDTSCGRPAHTGGGGGGGGGTRHKKLYNENTMSSTLQQAHLPIENVWWGQLLPFLIHPLCEMDQHLWYCSWGRCWTSTHTQPIQSLTTSHSNP